MTRWRGAIPVAAAAGSLALLAALVLQVAGRPLATNDLWWHLAMGRAYASAGPRLAADPSLHTARATPPQPVAWLFAVGVYALERSVGYHGLRLVHALLAAAVAALAFSLFRRESATPVATCLATGAWLVLVWPRLLQLRPDLVSMLATLLLYRLLLEPREPPSWGRVAAAAALLAVWANAHTLFMLGPCLLVAALLGFGVRAGLARFVQPEGPAQAIAREAAHARRLAAATVLGLVAALANPRGLRQHLAFVTSAGEGAIWAVRDDWTPFHPLRWDGYGLAAGLLEWLVADAVLALFAVAVLAGALRFLRRPAPQTLPAVDPVLFGLGLAALLAAASAVRFLWLAFLPLLCVLRAHATAVAARPAAAARLDWLLAAASAALAVALPASEGYARVASSLPRSFSAYLVRPYAAHKYHEPGVRFLEEAGIEGNLFNSYGMGGFLGYRLAPRLRTFLDGGMNVDDDVFYDYANVNARRGTLPGESFLDVLDRREVDVFFGVGEPPHTAGHLEGAPGWLLVARGPGYAVYLRANPRNARNLERAAAYYAVQGIPFDGERGLDGPTEGQRP